ncbi:unnamed protein product [Lactuca virosa]|uniref:Uncharacterized protein n=1 Tax=Lactuca virosa TaxID=75947 RepID=A0AAU9MYK8_9ASTR|nr:unnamed protein product [Lactuca virosa]
MSNTSVNFIYVCSPKILNQNPSNSVTASNLSSFAGDIRNKDAGDLGVIAVRFESKSLWIGWHFGSG